MRNYWYPNKNAQYMTVAEIRDAKEQDLVRDRDATFGTLDDTTNGKKEKTEGPAADIAIALLSVGSQLSLYSSLLSLYSPSGLRKCSAGCYQVA